MVGTSFALHFVISRGHESSQSFQIINLNSVTEVDLFQTFRDGTKLPIHQPLVTFPPVATVGRVQVHMVVPQSGEGPISLLVSKSAKPHDSMDGKEDRHFPTITRKWSKNIEGTWGKAAVKQFLRVKGRHVERKGANH
jgi:hypothetical protein